MKKLVWKIQEFLMNIKLWYFVKFNNRVFHNYPTPLYKEGYELTLHDDFFEDKIDTDLWINKAYFGLRFDPTSIVKDGKAPLIYFSRYNNVAKYGTLKQYAKEGAVDIHYIDWDGKDWGNYTIPYSVGMLTTKTFRQQYGYFEIRSKMPNSRATWPAFWLCGAETWPPEIDIYEYYGSKSMKSFESCLHWGVDKTKSRGRSCWRHRLFDLTEDFHVYACEWTPEYIKMYFDGICVRTFKDPKVLKWFNQPLMVILGNGVDDSKGFEDARFPNVHEVDYVKVYKKL